MNGVRGKRSCSTRCWALVLSSLAKIYTQIVINNLQVRQLYECDWSIYSHSIRYFFAEFVALGLRFLRSHRFGRDAWPKLEDSPRWPFGWRPSLLSFQASRRLYEPPHLRKVPARSAGSDMWPYCSRLFWGHVWKNHIHSKQVCGNSNGSYILFWDVLILSRSKDATSSSWHRY